MERFYHLACFVSSMHYVIHVHVDGLGKKSALHCMYVSMSVGVGVGVGV